MGAAPALLCGSGATVGLCDRGGGGDAVVCGARVPCAAGQDSLIDAPRCDPAGCVFEDTVAHLPHLEKMAFRFAGSNNVAALRWLFAFGAKGAAADSQGTTLLHVACRTGSMQAVQDLVRRGLALNPGDRSGWTPLHVATCMGREDVVLYLLQANAQPGCRTALGQTPQELCSQPCTRDIVVGYSVHERAQPHRPLRASPVVATRGRRGGLEEQGGVAEGTGGGLHFEPFFVPREPFVSDPASQEEMQRLGLELFNKSPGAGVAFLVAVGAVRDYPVEINNFLVKVGADPLVFGEFLGHDFPIAQTLRLELLNSLPLLGTGVVSALQALQRKITLPADWVKADRLTRGLAHFWWRQHDEEASEQRASGRTLALPDLGAPGELAGFGLQRCLLGTDGLHGLLFSTWTLHHWLRAGNQMAFKEWVQLNSGIEGGGADVPVHVQGGIYKALTEGGAALQAPRADLEPLVPAATKAPLLEGWAEVSYKGRSQAFHQQDSAAWPDGSPRMLAAQGGVTTAGRSSPMPGVQEEPPAPQDCAGVLEALELGPGRPGGGRGGTNTPEQAWLSLHGRILFLAHGGAGAPPYAFVALHHAVLQEADAARHTFLVCSRLAAKWALPGDESSCWLELCLLLGDGRFQPLEAPHLELRFSTSEEYETWAFELGRQCLADPPTPPSANGVVCADRRPLCLDPSWPDEYPELLMPFAEPYQPPKPPPPAACPPRSGGDTSEEAAEALPDDVPRDGSKIIVVEI